MALKDKEFLTNVNLNDNTIKSGHSEDIDENSDDTRISNKKYVDGKVFFDNTESDTYVTSRNNVGGIKEGDTVDNIDYQTLLNNMFFGRVDPLYVLPTFDYSFDYTTYQNKIFEVGTTISVPITYDVVLNDSSGLDTPSYDIQISGGAILQHNDAIYNLSYIIVEGSSYLDANINYLEATPKNDNLGDVNIVNSFGDGSVVGQTKDFVVGIWPVFKLSTDIPETFIENSVDIRSSNLYTLGKSIENNSSVYLYSAAGDVQVSFLVPQPTFSHAITILKDSYNIIEAFTQSTFVMDDFGVTGATKQYYLYTITYALPLSHDSIHELKIITL